MRKVMSFLTDCVSCFFSIYY